MLERQFAKSGGVRSLWRACVLRTLRARGEGNPWPEDHVVDLVLRAAQSPTSLTDAPELATVLAEFVTALVPYSAAAGLFNLSTNLTFGNAATIALPSISDLPQADWIREGAPMPVVQGVASAVSMSPHKIGTIVALSNEMMRSSSAEAVVREALMNNIGPSLDRSLFSAAPGTPGLRPPGLLDGVPPLGEADAAVMPKTEAMIEDLETLIEALGPYGGNGRIALICSARHSVRLQNTIFSEKEYPLFVASTLTTQLIAVAASALAVAVDPPRIDSSGETVMHMEDTNPLPIVGDPPGGVMATPVRSAWQTDSTGLRFVLPVSWVLRAPAVAWLTPTW
jgi:hypothetical protein